MLTPSLQHRAFQLGMDRFELKLRVKAGAARNANLIYAARAFESVGAVPAYLFEAHRARVQATLQKHYGETAAYFGKLALSGIREGRKSALMPVEALMADWVRRQALRKSRMIADTDRDDIAAVIDEGVAEGLGNAEIATAIRRLKGLTPFKAALIARTETHAAATYGSIESVRDAEATLDVKMLKAWLPTSDNRTRPEHLAMRNHPAVRLNEKFIVGSELMDRPGDTEASGANTINCRCSLVYEESE